MAFSIFSIIGLILTIISVFIFCFFSECSFKDYPKIYGTAIATLIIGIILIFVSIRFSPVDQEAVERRQKEEQRIRENREWAEEHGVDPMLVH